MKAFTCAALFSLLAFSASAFVPKATNERGSTSSLQATKADGFRVAAFSAAAAAYVAANVVAASPVLAVDNNNMQDVFGSSEVIAARSGGRAGGRASSGRAGGRASSGRASYSRPSSSSSYSSYRSSKTIVTPPPSYRSTTIVTPPPSPTVVISPPVTYGYSYNPLGGLGMGYAFGSLNNLGNEIRDIQQEGEIRRANAELQQSKMKEAELEARLRQLEMQNAVPR